MASILYGIAASNSPTNPGYLCTINPSTAEVQSAISTSAGGSPYSFYVDTSGNGYITYSAGGLGGAIYPIDLQTGVVGSIIDGGYWETGDSWPNQVFPIAKDESVGAPPWYSSGVGEIFQFPTSILVPHTSLVTFPADGSGNMSVIAPFLPTTTTTQVDSMCFDTSWNLWGIWDLQTAGVATLKQWDKTSGTVNEAFTMPVNMCAVAIDHATNNMYGADGVPANISGASPAGGNLYGPINKSTGAHPTIGVLQDASSNLYSMQNLAFGPSPSVNETFNTGSFALSLSSIVIDVEQMVDSASFGIDLSDMQITNSGGISIPPILPLTAFNLSLSDMRIKINKGSPQAYLFPAPTPYHRLRRFGRRKL